MVEAKKALGHSGARVSPVKRNAALFLQKRDTGIGMYGILRANRFAVTTAHAG